MKNNTNKVKNNKKFYDVRKITDLRDLITQSVKLYSDRPAFTVKKKNGEQYDITYKQYGDEIKALGTALTDMGLAGEKIAVAGDNSYEWCLSYMATVTGVGVIVPIDKELLFDDINMILNVSDVKLLFCDKKIAKKLSERNDEIKPDLQIVIIHADKEEGVTNITDLVAKGKELLAQGDTRYLDAEIDPDKMCSLLFTSGTTGMSKGVMLCHRNFCYEVMAAMGIIKITPDDCGISMLPLHHTYESTIILFFAPYCGVKVTFCDGFRYVLKNMKEFNPSVFVAVPLLLETVHRRLMKKIAERPHGLTMFKVGSVLVKAAAKVGIDLKKVFFKEIIDTFGGNMRLIICGAAPINPQILKDFDAFGIQIIFGYGLTECAPLAILNHDRLHLAESVGEVIPGSEAKILNPDENGIGEICVRGDMVMLGYYKNPEETAKVIDDHGWFHTGDLGYMDDKGHFYISGRCKNVIVTSNGKNIYPEELEYHLGTDIRVGESLVVADENKKGEVVVGARIYPNFEELSERYGKSEDEFTDEELDEIFKEVIEDVNKKLPPFKSILKYKIRRTEFTKTTTSKIKRHQNND